MFFKYNQFCSALPGRGLAVLACRGALRGGAAGEALCAAVGLGGCRAVVACRWGRAEAFAWAGAGLARRWPALPGPGWPALGGAFAQRGGLALRRAFRGARGRGSVVHCLQWCASGVRRGGLCAARAGVRCLAWAGGAGGAGVPVCGLPGGKQQSYKYSKKSMSRKHQSQHPLTTTRNFTSFFPESLSG